jgi:cytoskeleton protein RodZ
MVEESGSDARCGIGTRLRAGRERSGMTVLQAAEKLHVDAKMLEALEAERFSSFGAPVYVRGHLRNYADLVGEHFQELQQLFEAGTARAPTPDLTRAPRAPRPFDRRKVLRPALILLVGIVLACAVWWVLTRRMH